MPNFDGQGPHEMGCGLGRRRCGGKPLQGARVGQSFVAGRGMGCGHGFGPGRGRGWISVGYGGGGEESAAADMRLALQRRADFLKAELLTYNEHMLNINRVP